MRVSQIFKTGLGLLVVIGLAGGTTGCDKIKDFAEKAQKEAKEKQEQKEQDTADYALGDKLNLYVYCINHTSSSVGRASERYFSWVDHDKGPTGTERIVYGTHEIHHLEECEKKLDEAEKAEPELEDLEDAAAKWRKALDEVAPLNADIFAYYKDDGHKKDKFAHGKELHAKYTKALDDFSDADKAFRKAFREEKEELDKNEMERLKRFGLTVQYEQLEFLNRARELVETAYHYPLDKIDEGKLDAELVKTQDQLKTMKKEASKNKDQVNASWNGFVDAAEKYVETAGKLLERVKDKKPWTPNEQRSLRINPSSVSGSPDQVNEMFNRMITTSNRMTWPAIKKQR